MLTQIRQLLSGNKVYLTAIGGIITVLVAWSSGQMSEAEAIKLIVEALTAIFLRNAIAKTSNGK